MQRDELLHVIRASAAITNQYEFVVVGSQSIVGAVDRPPAECTQSMELDLYPLHAPELADLIDGSIGELSLFHERFGYYAQGVGPQTAKLPHGWERRLIRCEAPGAGVAHCLDPADLFVAKLVASREKDKTFNAALLREGIVSEELARERLAMLPDPPDRTAALRFLAVVEAARRTQPDAG